MIIKIVLEVLVILNGNRFSWKLDLKKNIIY